MDCDLNAAVYVVVANTVLMIRTVWTWSSRCDTSTLVRQHRPRFPRWRIPDRWEFSIFVQTLRETGSIPSTTVHSERVLEHHVEENENINGDVQRSPTTSTWRIAVTRNVSRTRIWRFLSDEELYPFHLECVQNLHRGTMASV
ncbi:hypothetical protein PR048_026040 [Dryococelus australis]|uniref:Uncharacterized protein n=1 Tax=Dryococelus australis TaxID=614101 RepID=A0ABQ9GK73_9NEOP|nr:hypothetical protein PR048_026040 [Dryococelus australis]